MKIRIEGCTAEELAEYSPYLSLGKVYETLIPADQAFITDEYGEQLKVGLPRCVHLPEGAKWVEVTNEKAPS